MDESNAPEVRITSRLVDSLYTEAMLLADEARSYFDDAGRDDRIALEPFVRVSFACESLKVTTRIMHIVAWLLTQRAVESGEIPTREGRRPERRLGHAAVERSDAEVVAAVRRAFIVQQRPQEVPLEHLAFGIRAMEPEWCEIQFAWQQSSGAEGEQGSAS